jgi:hypothetical protein
VIVTLPAAVEVPLSITVDHPDAQRFADRRVPTTTLDYQEWATLAGGRVAVVYAGPLRTGLTVPARMLTTAGTRASAGKPVPLSPDAAGAVDLSR